MWTKRTLIDSAFNELGLGDMLYSITPDQYIKAAISLDAMVLEWGINKVNIGWPFTLDPNDIDLDAEIDIPPFAISALYIGLAIRIAPSFGKQISPDTRTSFTQAWNALVTFSVQQNFVTRQLRDDLPRGAGSKPFDPFNRFIDKPNTDALQNDSSGGLTFGGS